MNANISSTNIQNTTSTQSRPDGRWNWYGCTSSPTNEDKDNSGLTSSLTNESPTKINCINK